MNIEQKMRLVDYCPNINIETMLINTGNSKTNESPKFILYLLQRVNTTSSNKHVALLNLSISYMLKNSKKHQETQNNSSNVK